MPPACSGLHSSRGAIALALWLVPDFLYETLVMLDTTLHDHVDQQVQQGLDVCSWQLAARRSLLDQQHQLLECQLRARRMHAGDGARVTGVHIAQIVEGLLSPQLR